MTNTRAVSKVASSSRDSLCVVFLASFISSSVYTVAVPARVTGASLALLVFMRGLLNTLRANLHDPLLVPVDQMLMHGMGSKDIRTRFRTYGFSVLMRVASVRSTCSSGGHDG